MRIILRAIDKPGALQVRLDNRPAHVAYLKAHDIVEMAGPLLNADGDMCGSVIILATDDMKEAEAFAANDPYARAGLFESVSLDFWNKVIG